MTFIKRFIVSLVILNFIMPAPLLAAVCHPNNLLSDEDLLNYQSMSKDRIQKFLESKTGVLDTYATSVFGVNKSAAQIIYDVAQMYKINPKYLLVRLEVEQGLISDSTPTQNQIDYAAGFGCPDGTGCSSTYKGFSIQVMWAAKIFLNAELDSYGNPKGYITRIRKLGRTISGWGPFITKNTLDGIAVTPENAATAALYTYTPWVGKYGGGDLRWGGSSLVWKKWTDWFGKVYPDGSLLQVAGQPAVYLIKNGRKRAFWSKSAFLANYNPRNILTVSQNDIDAYEDGPPIKFPEYSLLQGPDEKTYLIAFNEKHLIESESVFRKIGYNPEEVIPVESGDLKSYPTGYSISMNSVYPTGVLLQSKKTGAVSYVKNGTRHGIVSREILLSNFPKPNLIRVDDSEIQQYQPGEPLRFKDGTLITSPESHAVFVVSNGKRKRIASADVFNQLGYKWDNIVTTTDFAVRIHPSSRALNP